MRFLKKYKALFIFLFFITAGVLGYVLAQSSPTIYNEETAEANAQTQRIGVDCIIQYQYQYTLCGHAYEAEEQAPGEYIDLSKAELRELLEATSIKEFSPQKVILEKQYHTYCEKHVILYLEENQISAMQCEPYTDAMQKIWETSMNTDTLLLEEIEGLEKGKVFTTLLEAQAYIASFL